MAFDQNQIVKDLRPLKLTPTVPDEAHIAPTARNVETFVANPSGFDVGSPGSGTVFYPATVSEGGYVGLGYPNALPGVAPPWRQQVPVAVGHPGTAVGFNYAHNLGNLVVGNGKDRAGTENMGAGVVYGPNLGNRVGDCSVDQFSNDSGTGFGGSPSMRVWVGSNGADRASEEGGDDSVLRKKVKFLCSFGGKILPRPSDGMLRYVGGQTRIISVRKDTSFGELVQKMEDLYGQPVVIKYQLPDEDLDALVSVSCTDDLENMLDEYEKLVERSLDGSAKLRVFLYSSSELDHPGAVKFEDFQDSGQKYVEAVNGVADGAGRGITRKESMTSATSTQNSDFSVTEAVDGSGLGQSDAGGSQSTSATPHDMSPRVVVVDPNPAVQLGISPPNHYMHTYVGPRQEMVNCAMLPPQMGFPNPQLFGAGGPIYTQQQFPGTASGVSTGQFIPTVHMTMTPSSSLVGMRPTVMQQLQTRLDRYPEQSTFGGRVVQLPVSQNYNPYQGQVGGGYIWNPHVRPPEGLVFSDGLVPRQVMIPEKVLRLEDCYMCQKVLPHAHSDTVVQGQKGGVATSPLFDPNLVFHSLPTGDATRAWPMNTGMATRAMEECNIDQGAAPRSTVLGHMDQQVGFSPNLEAPYQNEKTSIPQVLAGDVQSPYGIFTDGASQQMVMPIQYPVKQEAMVNKPVKSDEPTVVLPTQTSEDLVRESPREYPDELRKEDMILKSQQAPGREGILDSAFSKPQMVMDTKPMEMPSSSHTGPTEPRGNVAVTGVESAYATHNNIPPGSEWMVDDASRFQRKAVLGNVETFHPNGNMPPSSGAYGDSQDFSSSLFSNQDPWNMRKDAHFVPPRPSKFLTKTETSYTPFDNNNLVSSGELLAEILLEDDRVHQPLGNSDKDSTSDCAETTKADELIKQELKATAEGVAANVLQTSISSASETNGDSRASSSIEMHHKAILEDQDKNTKVPEKVNLSYPVSDDIGRLQIINNSDLEELRELGSGTFGTVYHGKWRGTDVAIKRINERCFAGKASEQERMRDDFWNEAIKLADLHHPNVVAFYGIVLDGPGGSVATVTEFMVNGSLRNALQRNERNLDKRKRLLIAMDVAFGMEYLHGKNIVHFDLKSDNLLVNLRDPHRPICKVGDLGLSKVKCQTLISGGVRGTLPWMAPELLNGSSNLVSEKVDVFSFGIVLWELLTGEEPYADLHYGAIIGGIVSNTLRPPIPESCDQEWRSLMERCWAAEPAVRPNFTDVADELRSMAVKLPPRGQQQQVSSPQTQIQK